MPMLRSPYPARVGRALSAVPIETMMCAIRMRHVRLRPVCWQALPRQPQYEPLEVIPWCETLARRFVLPLASDSPIHWALRALQAQCFHTHGAAGGESTAAKAAGKDSTLLSAIRLLVGYLRLCRQLTRMHRGLLRVLASPAPAAGDTAGTAPFSPARDAPEAPAEAPAGAPLAGQPTLSPVSVIGVLWSLARLRY